MKRISKILVLVLSAIMVLAMSASVFAAGTGSITITPPTGVDANATNTYKIYKVFDATGDGTSISYKLVAGKTTAPAGFEVDSAGNVIYTANKGKQPGDSGFVTKLTAADIAAIAAYVTEADLVDTATSTGNADAVSKALPNGFYYITTSTGTAVTIDSTNPSVKVEDKNSVPGLNKVAGSADGVTLDAEGKVAVAQLGKTVPFEATITVGKGAKGYIFHDKMTTGLSYNNDVKVYIGETEVAATNYDTTRVGDDTLTVTFKDDYTKTLAEGTKLVVKYSATVTSDAITVDAAKNTAYVSYGDANSNNRTPDSEVEVYDAKITVNKKDGNGEALEGAGFVVKNAAGKYYKLANNVVTWVDSIDDATEVFSAKAEGSDDATAVFTGLGVGSYTLVEKTVPAGYNKAADQDFSVTTTKTDGKYQFELTANVTNNAGAELPATGGIGTTIFYVLGSLLVVGCGIVLVSRRRMQNK